MVAALLDANAYGIGNLITQKKRFRVPDHQRDYAWTGNEVATFLTDVFDAIQRGAAEYFVGTIVLIGPHDGSWEILDGQQRLATTTMAFAALRDWLSDHDKPKDAEQIDSEFISVRRLGSSPTPRLVLNQANKDTFAAFVANRATDTDLDEFCQSDPLKTSRLLVEAAKLCRKMIETWLGQATQDGAGPVERAYLLSDFLASGVRTVCLEVSTESEAYVIFESLNNRGQDLSVLDLVKNHIYGVSRAEDAEFLRASWARMQESIREKDADDFLKVFWTSHYGRVRLGSLFALIKSRFTTPSKVKTLSESLSEAAALYAALDDASNEAWAGIGDKCQHYVDTLAVLRAQQARPVMLSALRADLAPAAMERLLWELLVLTVRYQTVGRKRTGDLENLYAELAPRIGDGRITDPMEHSRFGSEISNDEEFRRDFASFSENNSRRALYLLTAIEAYRPNGSYRSNVVGGMTSPGAGIVVTALLKRRPGAAWQDEIDADPLLADEVHARFGNRVLLTHDEALQARGLGYAGTREVLRRSRFLTSRELAERFDRWDRQSVNTRQESLAEIAVDVWRVEAGQ